MRDTVSGNIHLKGFFALISHKERLSLNTPRDEILIRLTLVFVKATDQQLLERYVN